MKQFMEHKINERAFSNNDGTYHKTIPIKDPAERNDSPSQIRPDNIRRERLLKIGNIPFGLMGWTGWKGEGPSSTKREYRFAARFGGQRQKMQIPGWSEMQSGVRPRDED
ncbi:hypothetical protein CEXT_47431 [Caerostris extrusa]|uniref:Uncharacterized protein n=1 Tax=Caerostris extrusa TaxID=172846 RepID=A0AAV4VKY8_CAEEX|nr:hypothetical protein CEXT_47431 [Caerostris extrusa]